MRPLPGPTMSSASRVRPWRTTAIAIVLTGLGAIGLESVLQRTHPQLGMRRYDQRFTGSHPIEANERGFRGALPDPRCSQAVLCLGDSTTYGTGVAASATWPLRLGDQSKPQVLHGINAALPATDLAQATRSLDGIWHDQRPAAIAVALSGNMVSLALIRKDETSNIRPHSATSETGGPGAWRERLKQLPSDSAAVGGVLWLAETLGYAFGVNHHRIDPQAPFGAMLANGWTQAGLDPRLADDAWKELAQDLATLRDWCARQGVPLVVTWIPSRFSITSSWRDNLKFVPHRRLAIDANERCRRLCADLGVRFVDSLAALRAHRAAVEATGGSAALYVHGDYTHLDADGHEAVAAAMSIAIAASMDSNGEHAVDDAPE